MPHNYSQQLKQFHRAILQKKADVEGFVTEVLPSRTDEISTMQRLEIYQKGYFTRLVEVVLSDFPAVKQVMGVAECKSWVRKFVAATPSNDWDLNHYPKKFAAFLTKQTDEVKQVHRELTILEASINDVYWQLAEPALNATDLANSDEEQLGIQHFSLTRTAQIHCFDYAVNDAINRFRAGESLSSGSIELKPEWVLVVRHDFEVKRVVLDEAEYMILLHLKNGKSFNEALDVIIDADDLEKKLPHYIGRWLELGVLKAPV